LLVKFAHIGTHLVVRTMYSAAITMVERVH